MEGGRNKQMYTSSVTTLTWISKQAQHFFDYELRPSIGEAGSYFYHSHVDFQASTVNGPLIVEEADSQPPYSYDDERILFLSELFNVTDETATQWLMDYPLKW